MIHYFGIFLSYIQLTIIKYAISKNNNRQYILIMLFDIFNNLSSIDLNILLDMMY